MPCCDVFDCVHDLHLEPAHDVAETVKWQQVLEYKYNVNCYCKYIELKPTLFGHKTAMLLQKLYAYVIIWHSQWITEQKECIPYYDIDCKKTNFAIHSGTSTQLFSLDHQGNQQEFRT